MNKQRAILNFRAIMNMTAEQTVLFSHLFGNKGRFFTISKLVEKLTTQLTPEDSEMTPEELKAHVEKQVASSIEFLIGTKCVIQKPEQKADEEAEFSMPAYNIKDLDAEKQNKLGGKQHTTLTANGNRVIYKGDLLVFPTHPLSPEYKAGKRVGMGTVKSYHLNEEGFLYAILEQPVPAGSPEGTKGKTCAKKVSQCELLDDAIPASPAKAVTYKKQAMTKPAVTTPIGDTTKGRHLIKFNAEWSPEGKQMDQIIESLANGPMKDKLVVHPVDADEQFLECAKYGIRFAPTLILIQDGTEIGRMENLPELPKDEINAAILKFLKSDGKVEAEAELVADGDEAPKAEAPKANKKGGNKAGK